MPSYADKLSGQQIDDVTRYIRSLTRNVDTEMPSGEVPPSFDQLVVNPDGDNPEFDLREGRYVAADDVKAALDAGKRMVFLDARPTSDWLKCSTPARP